MQRIFRTCAFPNLHQLTLSSIESEDFILHLTDSSPVLHIFKQITHLKISTIEYYNNSPAVFLIKLLEDRQFGEFLG
ncbi:unnamed protein product [Rotaria magnacalcarata]|uniref:Uncharacterized protein n=2 Tax=Rotaria magnacalcarata TaxID=392030 RepID=A0A815IHY8_9BILA|nr:unnamed protein product [Rotaria magnacalcarata]CAF2094079.1 unnamed protein product [Rotaria magnacalcarata]CAF5183434.1 unnamed protein product [Rotaria magnacalcarata]CAF5198430.1 unnamed protein product [Rotaria magnacalcarata]